MVGVITPTISFIGDKMNKLLITGVIAISAVLGLSSCSFIGVAPATMDGMMNHDSKYSSSDLMFAEMMIPHHQQAVALGDLASTRAGSDAVRALALRIKGEQAPEINTMQTWLGGSSEDSQMNMPMDGMLSDEELAKLKSLSGKPFDVLYLQKMIQHHAGAIYMVSMIENSKNADVKALGDSNVKTQTLEVAEMKNLLAKLQ